jgi:hypothetical protein
MTKRCPFCAEEIQDDAVKCRHCGEWLTPDTRETASGGSGAPRQDLAAMPPVMPPVPPSRPQNAFAIAALVLGIVGLVLSITVFFGIVLGVLAVIFGGVAVSKANAGRADNKGMAITGLVLGIAAVAASILVIAALWNIGDQVDHQFDQVTVCIDHPHDPMCQS